MEHSRSEDQALSLYFPVVIVAQEEDFLSDIQNRLRIEFGNAVENVQRVDSNISLRRSEANQCIVKENVEPLLIEFLLLGNQESLAGINNLVI